MINDELKRALRKMLHIELEAMLFYQQATDFMQDEGAIYHFNQLASEELEHARTFYEVYPGDDLPELSQLIEDLASQEPLPKVVDQLLIARLTEQHALQLAIKMETTVAADLQALLKQVQSPAARAVIEKNIESTLAHLALIEEDYQRIFP